MFTENEANDIIQKGINDIPGYKKYSGTSVFICCPYHQETKPSLGINLGSMEDIATGVWHCFGCGAKGHWNKLAKTFDLERVKNHQFKGISVNEVDFSGLETDLFGYGLSMEKYAKTHGDGILFDFKETVWRRVTKCTMQMVGAKIIMDRREETAHVVLPVWINGCLEGIVKARMEKKKGELSYVTSEGSWVKNHGLFPFDCVKKMGSKSVVLVEGPRDALTLIDRGIPAIAILGAKNWGEEKRNLVLSLSPHKIILAFDGDRAGVSATNDVAKSLDGFTRVSILRLMDASNALGRKVDPANMSRAWHHKLKQKVERVLKNR